MRNTRILALLLAVTLLLSTLPASAAIGGTKSFSDVKSDDWFKPYVDKLSSSTATRTVPLARTAP